MNQGGYLLLSIVAFFLTGVGLFAADRKFTIFLRRFLHGWTSPESEPFPESKAKGLVYRQKAKQRFVVAGTISFIQTILSVYRLEFNPLLELVTLLIETPIMVLGTYLGDRMTRTFDRAQPVFDAIDRIEAGESTASSETRELIEDIAGKFRSGEANKEDAQTDASTDGPVDDPVNDPVNGPMDHPADGPKDDPRALMRKYTGE